MIYLDNNATTKPFPEVVETMAQFMTSRYWNASSAIGQLDGLEEVIESAKSAVRKLIGANRNDELIFTSGATESNAWAIAEGKRISRNRGWILSSQIEHPSILEPLKCYEKEGGEVRWAPVTHAGTIDLGKLNKLIDGDLLFASLMVAHNETGVIQPLAEAANLIRRQAPSCLIHTDATQAIGKLPFSVSADLCCIDLASLSAHKLHGPKGVGALFIREGVQIKPLISGGGQQNGLRSGTVNIAGIVGTSIAAKMCSSLLEKRQHLAVKELRDYFEKGLRALSKNVSIVGAQAERLPNTSFFGIPGTDADDLVYALATEKIALSKGSSCSAGSLSPSYTALLMGYDHAIANSLLRFSASTETSYTQVDALIQKLTELLN